MAWFLGFALVLVWLLGCVTFRALCKVHDLFQGPFRHLYYLGWPLVVTWFLVKHDDEADYSPR